MTETQVSTGMCRDLITGDEASTAVYIDFEGTQASPAQLLGVLLPDGDFTQFVLDQDLGEPARAKAKSDSSGHCVAASLDDAIAHIAENLAEDAVVISWSSHEHTTISALASPSSDTTKVLDALRDGRITAKKWKEKAHPDVRWRRTRRRGTHTLDRYMDLVGYEVPTAHGPNNTGKRLAAIHDQLSRRSTYAALTPTVKGKWTKLLGHNRHDCIGLREVVAEATG